MIKLLISINVGNLATIPVRKYWIRIGIKKAKKQAMITSAIELKKAIGFVSQKSLLIVLITRNPSRNVCNLETLPSGLSQ